MKISNSEFMNEVESVIQRLKEIESIAANLGTAIEYENPVDHKCYSAYAISRNALELIDQLEKVLSEMTSEN